jgi:6-phosphogluconolactonase
MNHRHALRRSLASLVLALLVLGCSSDRDTTPNTRAPSDAAGEAKAYWVYVGTYTGAKSKGIYRLKFDPKSGSLGPPELAAETPSPSFLAVHPGRRFLYAVNEVPQFEGQKTGSVSAFALDATTGALQPLNQKPSGGDGPCHLVVDDAGKNVLVANYGAGTVAVLPLEQDGRLRDPSTVIRHEGSGPNRQRQEGPHAHGIYLDRANRYAFVPDLGLDKVMIYRFDGSAGTLTPNEPPSVSVDPGAGPRHFAFHPSGRFAYVINELTRTVTAFTYDAGRGSLREVQTVSTLPSDAPQEGSTAEIQTHRSGKFVYGSNRGHDSIASFSVDSKTGRLTPTGHEKTQGKTPRNFAIDPTGRYLLAANQGSDTVVVFSIDPSSGKLSPTGTTVPVPTPVCVEFVPVAP